MTELTYSASLSRSQNRSSWSVIFRHPRRSQKNGRPGLRIRRGLGTSDETEAQSLVNQLNELLNNQRLWNLTARSEASAKYNEIIVSAFYDPIIKDVADATTQAKTWKIREELLPLPSKDEGYARAMLLGTTGVGKTTLLRQLIGTDPDKERFPSTAPAKTTIADTEIIMTGELPYQSVVTFMPRAEVRQYIEECVSEAVLAFLETKDRSTTERKLLEHSDQRFRLSYLLGRTSSTENNKIAEDEETSDDLFPSLDLDGLDDSVIDEKPEEDYLTTRSEMSKTEIEELVTKLQSFLDRVMDLAIKANNSLRVTLGDDAGERSKDDEDAFLQLLEESLFDESNFISLVDDILFEVESKFSYLGPDALEWQDDDWPTHWIYKSNDRTEFIETVRRFSSNYAPNFGRLLTPLVNGMRVSGPFKPAWYREDLKLVLIDGEGLGHTPDSASSVSTSITRRYDDVDAVLLVDNAAQPMQAAPSQVLKSLVRSGHHAKLIVAFTHFDAVQGVNLSSRKLRREHVISSFENTVAKIGDDMGLRAERVLKESETTRMFFLENLHEPPNKKNELTFKELIKLIKAIECQIVQSPSTEAIPVYDDTTLVLGIEKAVRNFRRPWRARLNIEWYSQVSPEHWTRIKALSRRLGELNQEEYDTLRPVADLLQQLQDHAYRFIENPISWEPARAPDEMKKTAIDNIMQSLARTLDTFVTDRLLSSKRTEWYQSYVAHRGQGSTSKRAKGIEAIYEVAAPIPVEISDLATRQFLQEIRKIVCSCIESNNGRIDDHRDVLSHRP
jgi:GTPase SAR1 family protein